MKEDGMVEFRDGWRHVPLHVEAMVAGLPTHRMTYEEAIKAAERRMVDDQVQRAQDALLREHFRVMR